MSNPSVSERAVMTNIARARDALRFLPTRRLAAAAAR